VSAAVHRLDIRLKRVFAAPEKEDGERILVDRLWPRGMPKQKAALDGWMKDLAPSTELRRWFGHDPARWDGFRARYEAELKQHSDLLDALRQRARKGTVTLLFAARDEAHNEAVVLKDALLRGG
jgi:uncharacterized protein YeaO (DUF488 family)